MKARVLMNNETDYDIDEALRCAMEQCAAYLLDDLETPYEVGLNLVSEDAIRALNKEFREKDSVTDVLSFALYDDMAEEEGYTYLGDSVICYDRALEQAGEYGHSLSRELVYLFAHSLLHMLGYDHETAEEKQKMRAKEEETMCALKLSRE